MPLTLPSPSPPPPSIYKILPPSPSPPSPLPSSLPLSPLDAKDQFIHLSTSSQILGTLNKFFIDVTHVYILRVPYERVAGRVVWEEAGRKTGIVEGEKSGEGKEDREGGQLWNYKERRDVFPHLYDLKLGKDEADEVGRWERKDGERWDVKGWPFGEDGPGEV